MQLPVCVSCEVEMLPVKNGVVIEYVIESIGSAELVHGDKYQCPTCRNQIVAGIARHSFSSHWQEGYRDTLKNCGLTIKCRI